MDTTDDPEAAGGFSIPSCLTSTTAKLVYFYILTVGVTTVPAIKNRLDLPALTVYQITGQLEDYGLINRSGDTVTVDADDEEVVTEQ